MSEQLSLYAPDSGFEIPDRMQYRGNLRTHDANHAQLVWRFALDWQRKGQIENLSPGGIGENVRDGEFGIVQQRKMSGDRGLVPLDLVAKANGVRLFI